MGAQSQRSAASAAAGPEFFMFGPPVVIGVRKYRARCCERLQHNRPALGTERPLATAQVRHGTFQCNGGRPRLCIRSPLAGDVHAQETLGIWIGYSTRGAA